MRINATISVLKIVKSTSVDGPGLRTSIYCAGCYHHCRGCHNPQSWDINNGTLMTIDEIMREIEEDDCGGVTFTGGDPFYQVEGFLRLAKQCKQIGKNIWCYTGFRYEDILADEDKKRLLEYIDVLVDGEYIEELRDEKLIFRGSANQRVIEIDKRATYVKSTKKRR